MISASTMSDNPNAGSVPTVNFKKSFVKKKKYLQPTKDIKKTETINEIFSSPQSHQSTSFYSCNDDSPGFSPTENSSVQNVINFKTSQESSHSPHEIHLPSSIYSVLEGANKHRSDSGNCTDFFAENNLSTYEVTITSQSNRTREPSLKFQDEFKISRKPLNKKSTGVYNNSYDNEEHDLICHTNDLIYLEKANLIYQIIDLIGNGTYGHVYKCIERNYSSLAPIRYVAIKIIKNLPHYHRQAASEVHVLNYLSQLGTNLSNGFAKIYSYFNHREHLCIVMELLQENMYQLLKRSQFTGLPIEIVQQVVAQLFYSAHILKENSITHADIKPENILIEKLISLTNTLPNPIEPLSSYKSNNNPVYPVAYLGCGVYPTLTQSMNYELYKSRQPNNPGYNPPDSFQEYIDIRSNKEQIEPFEDQILHKSASTPAHSAFPQALQSPIPEHFLKIKMIDFGSAHTHEKYNFSYIQSRFYRAPEVLLGLPSNNTIDVWSIGCFLFELLTGLPLFPGTSEFDQLHLITKVLGMPPLWMLNKGKYTPFYFTKEILKPQGYASIAPTTIRSIYRVDKDHYNQYNNIIEKNIHNSIHDEHVQSQFKNHTTFHKHPSKELKQQHQQTKIIKDNNIFNRNTYYDYNEQQKYTQYKQYVKDRGNEHIKSATQDQSSESNQPEVWRLLSKEEYEKKNSKRECSNRQYFDLKALDDIYNPSNSSFTRVIKNNINHYELLKTGVDFLKRCLIIDPTKRIEPSAALEHPFIQPILPIYFECLEKYECIPQGHTKANKPTKFDDFIAPSPSLSTITTNASYSSGRVSINEYILNELRSPDQKHYDNTNFNSYSTFSRLNSTFDNLSQNLNNYIDNNNYEFNSPIHTNNVVQHTNLNPHSSRNIANTTSNITDPLHSQQNTNNAFDYTSNHYTTAPNRHNNQLNDNNDQLLSDENKSVRMTSGNDSNTHTNNQRSSFRRRLYGNLPDKKNYFISAENKSSSYNYDTNNYNINAPCLDKSLNKEVSTEMYNTNDATNMIPQRSKSHTQNSHISSSDRSSNKSRFSVNWEKMKNIGIHGNNNKKEEKTYTYNCNDSNHAATHTIQQNFCNKPPIESSYLDLLAVLYPEQIIMNMDASKSPYMRPKPPSPSLNSL